MTYEAILSDQMRTNPFTNICEWICVKEIYIQSENINEALIIAESSYQMIRQGLSLFQK